MKVAVITESPDIYNLGARKLEAWSKQQGYQVVYSYRATLESLMADKAYLSALFTWDLPNLIHDANLLKYHGVEVEIGGPAATVMSDHIWNLTRIKPHLGIDERFEHVKGDFEMTFTQRGCPRGCEFCLVQKVEGKKIIEYEDYNIPVGANPKVGDNNILCTSWRHQEEFAERMKIVRNLDINSGFDDRIFVLNPEKYFKLYRDLKFEAWRFAFDKPEQQEPLKKCVDYLHSQGIGYRKITVFALIAGPGSSFEEDRKKLQFLIDIGCSPYPQRFRPFDTTFRNYIPSSWGPQEDPDLLFGYYGIAYIWKSCSWQEYLNAKLKGRVIVPSEQTTMWRD